MRTQHCLFERWKELNSRKNVLKSMYYMMFV